VTDDDRLMSTQFDKNIIILECLHSKNTLMPRRYSTVIRKGPWTERFENKLDSMTWFVTRIILDLRLENYTLEGIGTLFYLFILNPGD